MVKWQVINESTQETFINNLVDNIDRVKKLDE